MKNSRLNTRNRDYYDLIRLGVISKSTPNFTPKNSDMERNSVISRFLENFVNSWYVAICVFCDILRNHKFESLSLRKHQIDKEYPTGVPFLYDATQVYLRIASKKRDSCKRNLSFWCLQGPRGERLGMHEVNP